jgi:hypothetical protein
MQEDDMGDGDLFNSKCLNTTCMKGLQQEATVVYILNYFTTAAQTVKF